MGRGIWNGIFIMDAFGVDRYQNWLLDLQGTGHRVHAGKGKGEKCLLINFAYRRNLVESLNMSNSSYGIRITIRHVNNMLNIDYDWNTWHNFHLKKEA